MNSSYWGLEIAEVCDSKQLKFTVGNHIGLSF